MAESVSVGVSDTETTVVLTAVAESVSVGVSDSESVLAVVAESVSGVVS